MVSENMLEPGNLTVINREEIEETLVSKTSMMPNGLINTLNKDEILDLIAYLQSGGDPDAPVFAGTKKTAATSTKSEKVMFTEAGHTVDSLDIVKKSVESKSAVILDVREQAEWDAGHLADAQFIPLSKLKEAANVADVLAPLPKDLPIYVHCRSGGRVLMFAEIAQGKGYDIRPLKAGYDRLVEAGFTKAQ
jgi:rhodanese-related sulfurtransferase